jgi:cytoskeleton protein RodZ
MPGIGSTLQDARMRAGIDISDVEAATKIRAKYLRAIENEEWAMLPGPTFVKSFVRTYAEYLGLDARLLVDEYKLSHEPVPEHDPQPLAPPIGTQPRVRLRPPALSRGWTIGLSIAGLFVLLIVLGSIGKEEPGTIPPPTQRARRPAKPAPAPTPPQPTQVSLELIPNSEVYVCLRNAQDKLVVNETLTPGSERKVRRSKHFRLTLGNNAIEVKVNGHPVSIPPSSEPINYELTLDGAKPSERNACEEAG